MIFDFLNGKTAEYLKDKIQTELRNTSVFVFKPIENIDFDKITWEKGYFTYKDNKDEYLMFAHLKRSRIKTYGNPKFHTTTCNTRQEYHGFVFANKMPVSIVCSDTGQYHRNLYLLQCVNCIKESSIRFFSFFGGGRQWYDYVLSIAERRKYSVLDRLSNGYTVDWKQVSWARRELDGYRCQECRFDLSNKDDQFYLEVHHLDGDKTNNSKNNLKSLCVLCHSKVDFHHESNYSTGRNLLKINSFKNKFELK